jgi:hypothetical protein
LIDALQHGNVYAGLRRLWKREKIFRNLIDKMLEMKYIPSLPSQCINYRASRDSTNEALQELQTQLLHQTLGLTMVSAKTS